MNCYKAQNYYKINVTCKLLLQELGLIEDLWTFVKLISQKNYLKL